jgi:glycerol-3-phosphate acyltransferase PlsY
VSYLIGSINFSIIVTKLKKIPDIRGIGSGNAGFTNVLRSVGIVPAIITFVGDFLKGLLAVYLSKLIIQINSAGAGNVFILKYSAYLSGLACLFGHLYPCFFKFKGGKGILTSWAVTLLIDYRIFLIMISVFLAVLIISKIVSLGSLAAAVSYPLITFLVTYFLDCNENFNITYVLMCTATTFIVGATIVYKHIPNIKRLISGAENKISKKKRGE